MQKYLSPKFRGMVILYAFFYSSVCFLIFRQIDYLGIMLLLLRHKKKTQRNFVSLPHVLTLWHANFKLIRLLGWTILFQMFGVIWLTH